MWCPSSPSINPAPRAGSASAIPIRCRNTALPISRPSGGGIRPRRPRRARVNDGFALVVIKPPTATVSTMRLHRRELLVLGAGAVAAGVAAPARAQERARAEEESERHGMSSFGDLKYPPDFKHFDYVDPHAPK